MRESIHTAEEAPVAAPGTAARSHSGPSGGNARLRGLAKWLLRRLPRNRTGDRLFALAHFVYAHRRLPRRDSGLFNDYLFFLKTDGALSDALCQATTDKVCAKYLIDGIAGRKVTPETYAVFDSVAAIRRADLPDRCVLKPAHGHAQHVVMLEDAGAPITEADRETLRRGLALDVYAAHREVNYRYLRKRIICEALIGAPGERPNYKLFCYRGKARAVLVAYNDPATGARVHNYYDRDWNRLDIMLNHRPFGAWRTMPDAFPEMRALAERIAAHFQHVRVDTYLADGRVYVGELTHCHNAAHARFPSIEQERAFSRLMFG